MPWEFPLYTGLKCRIFTTSSGIKNRRLSDGMIVARGAASVTAATWAAFPESDAMC